MTRPALGGLLFVALAFFASALQAQPQRAVGLIAEAGGPNAQLQKQLNFELAFLRRSCALNDQQREQIYKYCMRELAEPARGEEPPQQGNAAGRRVVNRAARGQRVVIVNGVAQRVNATSNEALQEIISAAVEKCLPEEKQAAYQRELRQRSQYQREANIDAIMQHLDACFSLSESQFKLIRARLLKRSDLPDNRRYQVQTTARLPPVDKDDVYPLLNPHQRELWDLLRNRAGLSTLAFRENQFFQEVFWEPEATPEGEAADGEDVAGEAEQTEEVVEEEAP